MQRLILVFFVIIFMQVNTIHAADQPPSVDLARIKMLDMRTAQAVALAGNPDMAAAQARIDQARARVRQAMAAWWPSLDLSSSGSRQNLSDTTHAYNRLLASRLGLTSSTDQSYSTYNTGIQATWVLFDGFYRIFNEQQAAYDEQSTAAALANSRRLLINSVAEAFLNAQLAQTRIDIARADETFYLRQQEDAQNRYNVGAGPWGDVINIKVQVNTARDALIRAQREYEAAGYGLAGLMGLADATLPVHITMAPLDKECAIQTLNDNVNTLIQEAMTARPDIRQLEMKIKQAEATEGMAKAPLYPKVQLAGALKGEKDDDMGLADEDFGSSLGINMSWNLYTGGADKARIIEREHAKREAIHTLAGLRNSVAAEIRQDLAQLAAAEEQVRLQRETVTLVQENRDLAKNEYEAGESSLVRLNEAQRDLTTTHSRLAQALVSYLLQKQQLLAATGRNLTGFALPAQEK